MNLKPYSINKKNYISLRKKSKLFLYSFLINFQFYKI